MCPPFVVGNVSRSGAPGRTRTCGTRFRKPLLYPLSYEGASELIYHSPRGSTTDLLPRLTVSDHGGYTFGYTWLPRHVSGRHLERLPLYVDIGELRVWGNLRGCVRD